MPALRRGGRALSLSPKQRTLYFGVHAAVVAARLLRCFSNKGYKLSLHPVAAALAEPAAFAAALSATGVHAAVVAARLLRYFSNKGYSEVCPRARNESSQPERGSRQGFSRDISLEQGSQGQRP